MPNTWISNQQKRNKTYEKKQIRLSLSRQVEQKKDFIKKSFKSHIKQQWTTLANAITMKTVYKTSKISDVTIKPTIFDQTPTEPKKKGILWFFESIF